MDEELFSFICSNYDTPTPKIHRMLQQMAVDSYLNDFQLYLHAVRSKKVKLQRPNVTKHDARQLTLEGTMEDAPTRSNLSANERTMRSLRNELSSVRLAFLQAQSKLKDRVCFKALKRKKSSRNAKDVALPYVGIGKLDELMAEGIMDARELVDYAGVPSKWFRSKDQTRWFERVRAKAAALFTDRETECNRLLIRISELEEQLSETETAVDLGRAVAQEMTVNGEAATVEEEEAPLFSKMLDKWGYNAKVLSRDRIDCILMTDFLHRKPIQKAKMTGLGAEILKIDFEYKIVKKVHVYKGVGSAFRPYKCLATVQNEDNQTVYYKVCQGSEAIDEIKTGLEYLRNRNSKDVKVIYVDNCCSVRGKLLAIFDGAVVKLDPFHYMKRWDVVLHDPNSEEAAIFRGLMRRAIFVVNNQEYERAKKVVTHRLRARGKLANGEEPTARQVLQEARSVIPPKNKLEENIQAVLRYCYSVDFNLELKKALRDPSDKSPLPQPYFKPMSKVIDNKTKKTVSDAIATQIRHVKDDCLSDPPGIVLHRQNARTKKIFCCRGTPSCENDNLYIDALTGKSLGVGRCDRLLSTYFEITNDRKRWTRIGECTDGCLFTHRTERFGMVNSLHTSAGFKENDLPFASVCQPAIQEDIQNADLGFDSAMDILNQEASENEEVTAYVEAHESGTVAEEEDCMDIDEDDGESEVDVESSAPNAKVEATLEWLGPEIQRKESTMDAFKRLTLQRPWIPFHSGRTPKTALDREEEMLFETMKGNYNRRASPRGRAGYFAFMTAWNMEVAERYKRKAEGDESVILINRKSIQQLQQHYDTVEAKLAMAARVEVVWEQAGHTQMEQLNDTLRQNRATLPTLPPVHQATPVQYPQQGHRPIGNPTVLNPEIIAASLTAAPAAIRQQVPYNVLRPQQMRLTPLDGFKRFTWCVTCGYRKGAHEPHERFGRKCLKTWCGKCYQRREFHNEGKMGPYCPFPPHPRESQHLMWYT